MILFKIAFRNLREHKSQTLIIGTLIALGVAVLVTSNSVLTSVTRGMEASYVNNFTGDLIVRNTSEDPVSFIGGFGGAPEPLQNYPDVAAQLASDEDRQGVYPAPHRGRVPQPERQHPGLCAALGRYAERVFQNVSRQLLRN